MKQITFTETEISGGAKYSCVYTETQGKYGTVNVNNALVVSHTQGTADVNHTFSIAEGVLKVNIPNNNDDSGTEYALKGNVLTVNNGFTGSITATYEFTASAMRDIYFEYDHNGMRTQKKVVENGVTTTYDYILHGKLIAHMTKTVNGSKTDNLHFFYDAQSKPAFVEYNRTMYRYVHNLQGDIVGLLDASGNLVVEYKYDAWGENYAIAGAEGETLGQENPFRYRGYYFDQETLFYYLRSRYYSVEFLRFINADSSDTISQTIEETFGSNLYTYCKNVPTVSEDEDGSWLNILIGAVAGAVISGVVQVISNAISGNDLMDGVAVAAASGAITGAAAASGIPVQGQIVIGAVVGAGAEFTQQMIDKGEDFEPLDCFLDCTVAAFAGVVGAGIGGKGLLSPEGSVYKEGTRLLNVIRNVERGTYKSLSKASSRLASVGTKYTETYFKEAVNATVKYTAGAAASNAINTFLKKGSNNNTKVKGNNISVLTRCGPGRLLR